MTMELFVFFFNPQVIAPPLDKKTYPETDFLSSVQAKEALEKQ